MSQVVSQDELILHRCEWKRNGKRVIFVSGRFDLLHPGHIRLLEQARKLGDILIVGVESDASVRASFGCSEDASNSFARPIIPVDERMEILVALAAVDFTVEFDLDTLSDLELRLDPDTIVVGGSDPAGHDAGRRIVSIPLEPGFSTSRLVDRIKQLRA